MSPDADGYPYFCGSLWLEKTGTRVSRVEVGLRPGTRLVFPATLGSRLDGAWATVGREEFLAALTAAGCSYENNPQRASAFDQSSVTTEAGTIAFFSHYRKSEHVPADGFYLMSLYTRD